LSYGIPGDERLREHEQLDVVGAGLLDEADGLFDRCRLVHEDGGCVRRRDFEISEFGSHVAAP
jgi:hypothetical protein